jgi:hypothetical protein
MKVLGSRGPSLTCALQRVGLMVPIFPLILGLGARDRRRFTRLLQAVEIE